jgi:hypothetical protein
MIERSLKMSCYPWVCTQVAVPGCGAFTDGRNEAKSRSPRQYQASARSQSCFSDPKFRYRPRPSENCRLRIRWASSMPASVVAALPKDLQPPIEAHRGRCPIAALRASYAFAFLIEHQKNERMRHRYAASTRSFAPIIRALPYRHLRWERLGC